MEIVSNFVESPIESIEEIIAKFCDEFSYKAAFIEGTDKQRNFYNIQFSIPLENSNAPDNQVALSMEQNRACVETLQKELQEKAAGNWFIQVHRFPVHISIELVDPAKTEPVEEAED